MEFNTKSELKNKLKSLANRLQIKKHRVVTAESCTAGGLSFCLTSIAGSSEWFDRGFVTYTNQSKHDLLNVPEQIIEQFGAVSEETAIEMARGALQNSQATISISITGVAGPLGGTKKNPVGSVWVSCLTSEVTATKHFQFVGNRNEIREQTIEAAIDILIQTTL